MHIHAKNGTFDKPNLSRFKVTKKLLSERDLIKKRYRVALSEIYGDFK